MNIYGEFKGGPRPAALRIRPRALFIPGVDGRDGVGDTSGMLSYPFTFPKVNGRFIRRLNRFVVEAEVEGRPVEAHLANPGRLWELLLPGSSLLLSPALSRGRLPYTVLACEREGRPVLVHTLLTNTIIRSLVEAGRLPTYRDYRVRQTEPAFGRHRFDLLLEHRRSGRRCCLEIKSCTLFEDRLAMFPDAITTRGAEHLALLERLSGEGLETGCLFVIMNPRVRYFLPAYHIDPRFTRVFLRVKPSVRLTALALDFDPGLTAVTAVKPVRIPGELFPEVEREEGVYLLIMRLDRPAVADPRGGNGERYREGYYVYASPASANPHRETARHRRRGKRREGPLDELTAAAAAVTGIPVITGGNPERELAAALEALAGRPVREFTSPRGGYAGRLFHWAADPLQDRRFIGLIQHYRLVRPALQLSGGGDPPSPRGAGPAAPSRRYPAASEPPAPSLK